MMPTTDSHRFPRLQRRTNSFLPPVGKVVSEGFIETVFLLLGIGILLPWNAYISAKQYFVSRLLCGAEDDGENANAMIAERIEMWFSIIYNGACVFSLAAVILVQHIADHHSTNNNDPARQRQSLLNSTSNLSLPMMCSKTTRVDATRASGSTEYTWYMVMVPLALYLGVFCLTTLFVFVPSVPPKAFLMFTLSGLFVCGACTAVAGTKIVGVAGLFDANLGVNPYFNGQAAGGLLVACANLLASILNGSASFLMQYCGNNPSSLTASDATEIDGAEMLKVTPCMPYTEASWATAGYFALSCVILAACMVGYTYVDQYKRVVRKNSFVGDSLYTSIDDGDDDALNKSSVQMKCLSIDSETISAIDARQDSDSREGLLSKWKKKAVVSFVSYQNSSRIAMEYGVDSENSESVTLSVLSSVRGPAISLFFTYLCTLAIFPVWTSNLISIVQCGSNSRIRNDLFVPLSFVIFNGGDLLGRYLSSSVKFEKIQNLSSKLVWASALRMGFVLLFLLCKARSNRYSQWVVESDLFSWMIEFLFAVTNGFMTNVAFCFAPTLVENRTHHQQVASAILNFSLSFGLLVGSFFSGPLLQFSTGS